MRLDAGAPVALGKSRRGGEQLTPASLSLGVFSNRDATKGRDLRLDVHADHADGSVIAPEDERMIRGTMVVRVPGIVRVTMAAQLEQNAPPYLMVRGPLRLRRRAPQLVSPGDARPGLHLQTRLDSLGAGPCFILYGAGSRHSMESFLRRSLVLCLALAAGCADSGPGLDRRPAFLDMVAGNDQSGAVATALANPLRVRALNANGQSVPGLGVRFVVISGKGTMSVDSILTDEEGLAESKWTLGTVVADSQIVEARVIDPVTLAVAATARFTATPQPGPASQIKIRSGDATTTSERNAVTVEALVTDAHGNPVPQTQVSFAVTAGGGSVSSPTANTNASGVASVNWTVGVPGSQTLRASIAGGATVTFSATVPSVPFQFVKSDGDGQSAAPGTAVAVRPSVRLAQPNGNGISGRTVTFAVTGGGGTVSPSTVTTGSDGIARVDSWILGNGSSTNTLQASTPGAEPLTFTASSRVSPAITVQLFELCTTSAFSVPEPRVCVYVDVKSTFSLTSVQVVAAGKNAVLVSKGSGVFEGAAPMSGVARGEYLMTATVTDVNGNVTEAVKSFVIDQRPALTVSAPIELEVARPSVTVKASCTDDDTANPCTVEVKNSTLQVVAPRASPIDTTISLASSDGFATTLTIIATDSRGQRTTTTRTVYSEASSTLTLLGSSTGFAWDLLGNRLLFSRLGALGIQAVASGTEDTISVTPSGAGVESTVAAAFLTPSGAIAVTTAGDLYDWRQGTGTTTTPVLSTALDVSGSYAAFIKRLTATTGNLVRRDLGSGGGDLVLAGTSRGSVNANGDVVWQESIGGDKIYRYRTEKTLIADGKAPVTDGVNIVFEGAQGRIMLYDGTTVSEIGPPQTSIKVYVVNGGWTAFTRLDIASVPQVWTRSPTGVLRQVSIFGTQSVAEAVGTDGSVVFKNGTSRYYIAPTGSARRISSSRGTALWRDGRFVIFIGRSAFAIAP
jgi:hypothetical protein